jgi:hypothetical protein
MSWPISLKLESFNLVQIEEIRLKVLKHFNISPPLLLKTSTRNLKKIKRSTKLMETKNNVSKIALLTLLSYRKFVANPNDLKKRRLSR